MTTAGLVPIGRMIAAPRQLLAASYWLACHAALASADAGRHGDCRDALIHLTHLATMTDWPALNAAVGRTRRTIAARRAVAAFFSPD